MVSAESNASDAAPWAAIAAIIATVSVFAISQGLTYPLLSILLQRQGETPGMIGLSAAMTPLGFIVSSPLIPWMARQMGASKLAIGCAVLAATMLFLIASFQNIWAWFPLRFLLGFVANPLYVVSETWMIALTPARRRGRLMGVYTSIVSGGFAVGPLTLAAVGTTGWPPFLVGIAAFLSCAMIVALALPKLPPMQPDGHERTSVLGFARIAPLLLFAVFTAAAFEQALLAMFPIYGAAHGSTEQRVALLIAVFIVGNVAFQLPLGILAERLGARAMMMVCAAIATLGAMLLPILLASTLAWPLVFVWGAVAFGIYTMSLIELGERFSGSILITGNAAFALAWGFGGIGGPPFTGLLMNGVGIEGLPMTLGALAGTLLLFLILRRGLS